MSTLQRTLRMMEQADKWCAAVNLSNREWLRTAKLYIVRGKRLTAREYWRVVKEAL